MSIDQGWFSEQLSTCIFKIKQTMNINAPLVCLEPLTAGVLIWKGMGV